MSLQIERDGGARARDHHRNRKSKRQREQRKQRRDAERKQRLDALPAVLNDDMVLTVHEWAALNRISTRTGRRILDSGRGPIVTQLSAGRIGITVRANRQWQESRARA